MIQKAMTKLRGLCMHILKSNIKKFIEKHSDKLLGFKNSKLTNSGSEAIKYALINANIQKKTYIVVPVTICRSVVDVILDYGCYPLFCDVDNEFCLNIDKLQIPPGVLVSSIIYVHAYGLLKDISKLVHFCEAQQYVLIEDSAQYFCVDRKYENITQGDYVIFSFGEGKPISAGEYGLLTSNKKNIDKFPIINNIKSLKLLYKKLINAQSILKIKQEKVKLYTSLLNQKNDIILNKCFIDNVFHRLLYFHPKNYQHISDKMYDYMKKTKICNLQSTIVVEAFQEDYLKKIKKVNEPQSLILTNYPNYAKLKKSYYYFRTHDKTTKKSIYKICKYFNNLLSNDEVSLNDH